MLARCDRFVRRFQGQIALIAFVIRVPTALRNLPRGHSRSSLREYVMSEQSKWTREQYSAALDTRFEMEEKIIVKAWQDTSFRELLLSDPHAALAQLSGVHVPDGLPILVREETPTNLVLRLSFPPTDFSSTEELSDEALEQVAGGGLAWSREGPGGGESWVAFGRRTTPTDFVIWSPPTSPTPVPGTPPSAPPPDDEESGEKEQLRR
jgi:hypothetical protein